jgi:hypothetical protein
MRTTYWEANQRLEESRRQAMSKEQDATINRLKYELRIANAKLAVRALIDSTGEPLELGSFMVDYQFDCPNWAKPIDDGRYILVCVRVAPDEDIIKISDSLVDALTEI